MDNEMQKWHSPVSLLLVTFVPLQVILREKEKEMIA